MGGQEDCGTLQFFYLAPATGGRSLAQPRIEHRIVGECFVQRGFEVTWPDRIDLDAIRRPVRAHAFGKILNGAFGCRVRRDPRAGGLALQTGNVDDLAASARNHLKGDRLTDQKYAVNIPRQDFAPSLVETIL